MKTSLWMGCLAVLLAGCGAATESGKQTPPKTESATQTAKPAPGSDREPASTPVASNPAKAPAISLQVASWAGVQELVKAHPGRIVVIDIWSTTCPTCRRDFPQLVTLHREYGNRGVVCVSFNCDYDGIPEKPPEYYRERVLRFLTQQQATLLNLQSDEALDQLLEKEKISGMPSVMVYNRTGELAKDFHNANVTAVEHEFRYDDIRRLVEDLLAIPPDR